MISFSRTTRPKFDDLYPVLIFLASSTLYNFISIRSSNSSRRKEEDESYSVQDEDEYTLARTRIRLSYHSLHTAAGPAPLEKESKRHNSLLFDTTYPCSRHNGNTGYGVDHHFPFSGDCDPPLNCFEKSLSDVGQEDIQQDNEDSNSFSRRNITSSMLDKFHNSFRSLLFDTSHTSSELSDTDCAMSPIKDINNSSSFESGIFSGADISPQRYIDITNDAGSKSESNQNLAEVCQQQKSLIQSHHHLNNARANYNSKIMPQTLTLIRHGQSEGNVNEALYATQPDSSLRLTKLGWDQARMAGKALREKILRQSSDSSVHFIVSPYVRTMETFHGLASAWVDPVKEFHQTDEKHRLNLWYGKLAAMGVTFNEDPRIREQDFGNYQNKDAIQKAKKERHQFGAFYYRFPNGESASDVFDRVSTFLDSLWRSFSSNRSQNYVLVTHGISIRVLLARYFRYSVDQFNMMVKI